MVNSFLLKFIVRYYFRVTKAKKNQNIKINVCNFTKPYSLY